MKLRIKRNSLRFRVSPSEMVRLVETGRVEETIHFGEQDDAKLTYALEHSPQAIEMSIDYRSQEITVVVPTVEAHCWAASEQVGIYGEGGAKLHLLELVVEKDWACLDKGEVENKDTFPNPRQGAVC